METYEIVVSFDDETAGQFRRARYSSFIKKYNAEASQHPASGLSTIVFTTTEKLTKEEVERELQGLEVVVFLDTCLETDLNRQHA
ncbi:MAG TPA: hypothetical protein VJJ21_02435 [Candidatus Nanoarchaeia archaeon]|nr:hypothetical protein [Candidatus Nanoarchaeia archaeon]